MSAVLHNRTGGSANDLHETYNSAAGDTAGSALRRLIGHPSGGTWTLQVSDRAPVDVGRLDAWSLELDVDAPPAADTVVP
jgi:subtilisin-like proprotein convertase family protein